MGSFFFDAQLSIFEEQVVDSAFTQLEAMGARNLSIKHFGSIFTG